MVLLLGGESNVFFFISSIFFFDAFSMVQNGVKYPVPKKGRKQYTNTETQISNTETQISNTERKEE